MKKFLTKSDIQIASREQKKSLNISKNTRVTEEAQEFARLCGISIIRTEHRRRRFFLGNWKMNNSLVETNEYFKLLGKLITGNDDDYIGLALPSTHLFMGTYFQEGSAVKIGAQNFYPAEKGAYTGETSISFLNELAVKFVLIGHSERRHVLGEDQSFLDKKIEYALKNYNGKIIYCIGETFEEKNSGRTLTVLRNQLEYLKKYTIIEPEKLVIAYEPVWAIGTGLVSENEDIERISVFIRELLNKNINDSDLGDKIPILYGGSVNTKNVKSLSTVDGIDGFLIGGASLKAEVFSGIYEKYCERNKVK
ncbi:triose-phosphate isomerase [bacterium]|nr:triose-phosphate isomerase [bacterium]